MGQGSLLDGMFKLNVLAQVPKNNDNKTKASAYTVELCDMWALSVRARQLSFTSKNGKFRIVA